MQNYGKNKYLGSFWYRHFLVLRGKRIGALTKCDNKKLIYKLNALISYLLKYCKHFNKYFNTLNKFIIKFIFAIKSEVEGNNFVKYFMCKYKVRNYSL